MLKTRKIAFSKWIDPMRDNPENIDWPDWGEDPEDKYGVSLFGNPELELKEMMKNDEMEQIKKEHETGMKVLNTPAGIVPLTEYSFASRTFNFWVVHTNFAVTNEMIDFICDIDGIEDILPMTKHRFRISIGRLFDVAEIMNLLQELMCMPTNMEVESEIYTEIKELKDKISCSDYWAIFVIPNGKILYISSEVENEEFKQDLAEYLTAHKKVGGILWTYRELEPSVG